MKSRLWFFVLTLAGFVWFLSVPGFAEEKVYELTIKDHRFYPEELIVPSGEKIKLVIKNEDETAEEFESYDLSREVVIKGKSTGSIFIGPLKSGKVYKYVGDFHKLQARGIIKTK